ncbi:MAG: hypothetical protein M1825_000975 [Sarcosagium campestre]|nr:MAG: hypothetical protein M1825_000975 [Sarcosagium campestre]
MSYQKKKESRMCLAERHIYACAHIHVHMVATCTQHPNCGVLKAPSRRHRHRCADCHAAAFVDEWEERLAIAAAWVEQARRSDAALQTGLSWWERVDAEEQFEALLATCLAALDCAFDVAMAEVDLAAAGRELMD